MATEEWVNSDEEIWHNQYSDDFIWLPGDNVDGVGIYVAGGARFSFTAEKQPFDFIAEKIRFNIEG